MQQFIEFIKHAHAGVKAIEGARVPTDGILACFYLLGVATVYMDDTIDFCFLETFPCISIWTLSRVG